MDQELIVTQEVWRNPASNFATIIFNFIFQTDELSESICAVLSSHDGWRVSICINTILDKTGERES